MITDPKRIEIKDSDKKLIGLICDFCNRVFDDMVSIKQVVTVGKSKSFSSNKKIRWMCDFCEDQGRYVANDGTVLADNKVGVTIDQIMKEWDNKIFSEYRRQLWRTK